MRIVDTFLITGRGLAVAIDQATELPVGRKLVATVLRPDGGIVSADAFKEWLLRRNPERVETEAFLLVGLSKSDAPIGSDVRFEVASSAEA